MKIRFDPQYRIPDKVDGIALYIVIPRYLLQQAMPNYTARDSIPFDTLVKLLEESEFEPYPVFS